VDPAQFLEGQNRCVHRFWPGTTCTEPPFRRSPCIQRPNPSPEPIPARSWRPEPPEEFSEEFPNSGRKNPAPVASTGGRSGHFGTLWERPAGTQTHSRRTGRRLGQLRCTRQGLVRVSESNTKYGGQRGKTGGNAAPVMDPSISESSGIPKRKKSLFWCGRRLRPLFTGQVFIRGSGLRFGDSRKATDISGQACQPAGGFRRL
jgi:hypothetical protein